MKAVSFVGIGAQKSASTWLYDTLGQLPDTFVSDPKELDFFTAYFDRGYEWYERFFAKANGARWRGEVSPSYFISSDAPKRVFDYNPGMRILVTLRDPVDRAFSNHLHEVRAGHVSGSNLDFDAALENNPLYRHQGLYARHLENWLTVFPRDQVLVTFQEDVKRDSLSQTQRLAGFLGLPIPQAIVPRRANESVGYNSKLVGMSLWRVGQAARRAGLGDHVEKLKTLPVVRELRRANIRDIRKELQPMSADTRARLRDYFQSDVRRLEDLLGQTAPWPDYQR